MVLQTSDYCLSKLARFIKRAGMNSTPPFWTPIFQELQLYLRRSTPKRAVAKLGIRYKNVFQAFCRLSTIRISLMYRWQDSLRGRVKTAIYSTPPLFWTQNSGFPRKLQLYLRRSVGAGGFRRHWAARTRFGALRRRYSCNS